MKSDIWWFEFWMLIWSMTDLWTMLMQSCPLPHNLEIFWDSWWRAGGRSLGKLPKFCGSKATYDLIPKREKVFVLGLSKGPSQKSQWGWHTIIQLVKTWDPWTIEWSPLMRKTQMISDLWVQEFVFRVWRFDTAREDGCVLVKRFQGVNYGRTVGMVYL